MAFAITNGFFSATTTWDTGVVPTGSESAYSNSFTIQVSNDVSCNALLNSATTFLLPGMPIPVMTSNTTPSGQVFASTFTVGQEPWKAFDQNTATSWAATSNSGILGYIFPTARVIKRYLFRVPTGAQLAGPNTFTFQASSNSGITWTDGVGGNPPPLDSRSGINVGSNGTFTSLVLPNTIAYDYYRLVVTSTNGSVATTQISEFEMTEFTGTVNGGVAGGSFALSTPNTTVSVNSLVASVTNLIIANATSGTNTLNVTNGIQGLNVANSTIINHTGASNLTIIIPSVIGGGPVTNVSSSFGIAKSGLGTLTVGNSTNPTLIRAGAGVNPGNGSGNHGINSSSGDIVIVGIVQGPINNGFNIHAIVQSAGNLTITGNVIGGNIVGYAIASTSSGLLDITGNVTGGSGLAAISKTAGAITVTGNVSGSTLQGIVGTPTSIKVSGNTIGSLSTAISITNAAPINIVGDVIAGSTGAGITTGGLVNVTGTTTGGSGAVGISATGNVNVTGTVTAGSGAVGISSSGTVTIPGPLVNNNGYMAVSSPSLFITSATTYWSFTSSGGSPRILYTDAPTNVSGFPSTTDVRIGTVYGPTNTSIGTMNVPLPSDVRINVPTDNTVGTATLTAEDLFDAISGSTSGVGLRLKNVATVATVGKQIASFNI